jgi:hypothetical protein
VPTPLFGWQKPQKALPAVLFSNRSKLSNSNAADGLSAARVLVLEK